MADLEMETRVNGRDYALSAQPRMRLLDYLRDTLKLTGTKEGCGAGECGTCSVFVDGVLVKSCLLPVSRARGREIVTVEGLAAPGALSVVQRAFHKTSGSQCGYCIPGFVMAATATLQRNPQADLEQIKEGLGGNICRCTGYQKIIEAVELARDVQNGTQPEEALEEKDDREAESFIGAKVRRQDAPAKVSGALKYAGDMEMPQQLHLKVLRSPHAHARILAIDASAALATPGVVAVLTSEDVPGRDGYGVFVEDQPVLARDVVRHVGEGVAAVVAEDAQTAEWALAGIIVRYEPLPGVFDAEQALEPGAPVLHEAFPGNLLRHVKIRKGDVEAAFSQAHLVVEQDYATQRIEHAYLEPEAGLAYREHDGTLTVVSPSQNITHHRHMLAHILDLPINKVRMIMSPVGGGFGGKEDMLYQALLALAVMKTHRPVKYVFTREESFVASSKRHPFRIRYKMGLSHEGRIIATQMRMVADGGAYACSTPGVMNKAAILGAGPYAVDNVHIDVLGVYTNNTPSGAMRSFGAGQSEFATEAHLDLCAEKMRMDPFQFRRLNGMRDGAVTHTRHELGSVSLMKTLDAAEQASGWAAGVSHGSNGLRPDLGGAGTRAPCTLGAHFRGEQKPARYGGNNAQGNGGGATENGWMGGGTGHKKRGRGVASCWYGISRTVSIDRAGAWAELDDGGTAKILTGVTEIGEGILNVLVQIAAEEMGIRPEDVTLGDNDTARVPEAAHAGATRQTYMIGNAVALACRDTRQRLDAVVAAHWEVAPELIRAKAGKVWAFDHNLSMTMGEAVALCKSQGVVPVGSGNFTARGTMLDPEDGHCEPWQAYVFGTQVAEVEVDTATGEVQVLGIWAAHDVGRAVNPAGVEGQIEGGVVMAVGQALMEEFGLHEGHSTTPGFAKYILPTALDVPRITSVIVEDPDPKSPLGAKGIGEPAMIPTAPAIVNAIHDAVGVRMTSLPVTPEKVLAALKEKQGAAGGLTASKSAQKGRPGGRA